GFYHAIYDYSSLETRVSVLFAFASASWPVFVSAQETASAIPQSGRLLFFLYFFLYQRYTAQRIRTRRTGKGPALSLSHRVSLCGVVPTIAVVSQTSGMCRARPPILCASRRHVSDAVRK
ncbi:hypothetical protein J3E74DRAFT_313653, partial [Bipolaris maydis]